MTILVTPRPSPVQLGGTPDRPLISFPEASTPAVTGDGVLLETGDDLLLETADRLLME